MTCYSSSLISNGWVTQVLHNVANITYLCWKTAEWITESIYSQINTGKYKGTTIQVFCNYNNWVFATRVCSMTGGYIFTGVCLLRTEGNTWSLVPYPFPGIWFQVLSGEDREGVVYPTVLSKICPLARIGVPLARIGWHASCSHTGGLTCSNCIPWNLQQQ